MGPGPAAAPAQGFSATAAIGYGWRGFKNNLGPIAVIAVVVIAVNVLVNLLFRTSGNSWILSTISTVVSLFISLVIGLGLIRAALLIIDGRRPTISDLLSTDGLLPYFIASLLVSVIVMVGTLLCIIPGLIAAFLLQFFGYAIVDKRTEDPIEAIKMSFRVVSGNIGELLLFGILVILLNLAGALLCGLGLIVTIPVTSIAVAFAWRWFSRGPIAQQA